MENQDSVMKKTPPSPPPSYNEAVPMQMTMPMPVPVDMPIMPGASSNTPVRLPPGFQHQMPPRPPKNCAPTAPNSAELERVSNINPTTTTYPQGLQSLIALDQLLVKQQVELAEVVIGWECENKYMVLDAQGNPVFFVYEESSVCNRMFLGSLRSCEFRVLDRDLQEVFRFTRPFNCQSCCCPCCLQVIDVFSNRALLGSVRQNWSILRPSFSVLNEHGESVLEIEGPIFQCIEAEFKIKSPDGKHRVGVIKKKWRGFLKEALTDADVFGVRFPIDLDVKMKGVMLAACLLIDVMYFEQKNFLDRLSS